MKRFLAGLATVVILSPLFVNSAVVGDINQDGKIDLMESIYALQVASGAYPTIDDSCLLTGQGVWEAEKDYNLCDVVTFSEITYACASAHSSIAGVNEPPDTTYWTVLSIKGDTGPPGPSGTANMTVTPEYKAIVTDGTSTSVNMTETENSTCYLVYVRFSEGSGTNYRVPFCKVMQGINYWVLYASINAGLEIECRARCLVW